MTILRQVLVALSVAVVAGGLWLAQGWLSPDADGKAPESRIQPVPVKLAEVARATIADSVQAVGTTRAHQAVTIVPLAAGRIVELAFEPGADVKRGDLLVRLDDDAQRAEVEEAEATLRKITQSLDRARQLLAKQTVSKATVDDLVGEQAAAAARLDRAKKDLADREIRAPFSGVVGFHELDAGARVEEGQVITTLDDLSILDVEFLAPEVQYGRLRPGMVVRAASSAFPKRNFVGLIDRIDTRVGEVSRAFRVRAALPNSERLLPAGLFVNVEVVIEERLALTVPEEAVIADAGGNFVFVVADGKAERRPIKVGMRSGGAVEVLEGLSEGESVVREGMQRLRDGMPVRLPSAGS